jgi:hypothetical protein
MSANQPDADELPEKLQEIKGDESKALRAERDIGEKAAPDADTVDDPRTAVRFDTVDDGVPKFRLVKTRLSGFPLGKDDRQVEPQDTVAKWVRANDPEIIDASDEQWEEDATSLEGE